ncbi:sugar phosphate isomerase/epimerase family protein [Hydrogenophaga sp.]|jgi:D-psicose/D-tagatose/L-ribulose 3-epimerase|uniref:sugar phosphate isomerase/epimerase family protein n=1 Tax=Hydrogenophaga sp. TaxID=1904254 RepID=UPI003F7135B6
MKLALCNEVLLPLPLAAQCEAAARMGYDALEIAPFTLADDPTTLDETTARELRATALAHGLKVSSLHWLLVKPEGLSLVTDDAAVRRRTLDLLRRLIDFAAACGASVLVHGSPKQRSPAPGQSVLGATVRLESALAELAPHAADAGVTYCLEPLAPFETPVINTVAEAAAMVDRIGSPAIRTMLDVSAASHSEHEPVHEVLLRFLASGHIAHVQVNDKNRRGPGQGETRQRPVLQVLKDMNYDGWVAVEPFEYLPDGPGCAEISAHHVREIWRALP